MLWSKEVSLREFKTNTCSWTEAEQVLKLLNRSLCNKFSTFLDLIRLRDVSVWLSICSSTFMLSGPTNKPSNLYWLRLINRTNIAIYIQQVIVQPHIWKLPLWTLKIFKSGLELQIFLVIYLVSKTKKEAWYMSVQVTQYLPWKREAKRTWQQTMLAKQTREFKQNVAPPNGSWERLKTTTDYKRVQCLAWT